jgi:hypothetical protein
VLMRRVLKLVGNLKRSMSNKKKKKTPPFIKRLEIASLCLGFQEGIYQELARESSALSVVSWRCPTADMQMPHRRQ